LQQKNRLSRFFCCLFKNYIAACSSGVTIQHSLHFFPDPQKHISSFPQHAPYIFSPPQVGHGVVSNLAFCASSIFLKYLSWFFFATF